MKDSFGELILKKDSILYCKTSSRYNDIIQKKNDKCFLYDLYFHPSQIRFLENLFRITLKKDISTLFIQKYIVSIIDIDKNSGIVDEFKIKGLPTSVVIDSAKKELARKIGYKKEEYENWLKQNTTDFSASWIDTK